jgi:DNA-binding CsgD family transcriptional regulator
MTVSSAYSPASHAPRAVGSAVEAVLAARGNAKKLSDVFDRSPVPMVLIDNGRRYHEVNPPARLLFRLSLAEMRSLRPDDLVPPDGLPSMIQAWERALRVGFVTGTRELSGPDGGCLRIVYYGLANALPGRHVGAFAPAGWSSDELGLVDGEVDAWDSPPVLTPREREILQVVADGLSGPETAEKLVISPATVKSHFRNIHLKLEVPNRAAAVAKAMRLGYIT